MPSSSAMTSLSAAANALKSAGSSTPINKQIDTVSNVLTGTRRKREMTSKNGYPQEVKNVLEILKIQINKAINALSDQAQAELTYNKLVDDLEIIEDFASRIMKFYQPKGKALSNEDKDLTNSVKHSFARAKSEAVTTLALEKIFLKINNLENRYLDNPNMTCNEFRQKLNELSVKVKKWEDELLPKDPILKESETIARRVYKLKNRLNEAIEISNSQEHPGVIGEMGVDILRIASGMVQHAKTQFEVEQGVMMAIDANRNLRRSGHQYQERGRSFNLLIQQSIAVFVGRQIRKLELELRHPLYFFPGDVEKNEGVASRLIYQMEQLITYFEFVCNWSGSHQEDLLERIALVYEQIVERAKKAKYLILEEARSKGTTEEKAVKQARVAVKYRLAETLGRDIINPNQIFNEKSDTSDKIQNILDKTPDPTFDIEYTIPEDKLGRVYYEILNYISQEGLDEEFKNKLQTALIRIEYYAMRQQLEIDIFDEIIVRSEYMKGVIEQDTTRFMVLLGMDPVVTLPERYQKYPDPSEYPFKGNHLLKVVNNYRIVDNFLKGRYGKIDQHPMLIKVSNDLFHELEGYCEKVFIELIKMLNLNITKPPQLSKIESILNSRIQVFSEEVQSHIKSAKTRIESLKSDLKLTNENLHEAIKLQELWLMFEYMKYPQKLKQINYIPEQIFEQCRLHKHIAEKIIIPMTEKNPKMIQNLVIESVEEIVKDAVRVTFELEQKTIAKLNKKNQFRIDHQVAESLPLYVQNLTLQREMDEDVHSKLLTLVHHDKELAEKIESLATRSMFTAPLQKVQELLTVFSSVLKVSNIEVQLEEITQFLSINDESDECILEGFGAIIVNGPNFETEQIEELGSLIMKVKTKIVKDQEAEIKVSFIDHSYNSYISEYRDGQIWNLL